MTAYNERQKNNLAITGAEETASRIRYVWRQIINTFSDHEFTNYLR